MRRLAWVTGLALVGLLVVAVLYRVIGPRARSEVRR
jgi:hypothetical protein